MVSLSLDIRMLVLAVGFWVTLVWTEKILNQDPDNPWDRTALLVGNFISTLGAFGCTIFVLVISFSLLMFPDTQ
jgi:hypothetical protein